MSAIFLSASVPIVGRGTFHEGADPFLIQYAVRELLLAALGRRLIVWGGHPAITPMVWAVCEDLNTAFADSVVLYQSAFFAEYYPGENEHFGNVVLVEAVKGDKALSLARMRERMLSRTDISAGVFIGGMEGVLDEYAMLKRFHPDSNVIAVAAPGGAARRLAEELGVQSHAELDDVDFAALFHSRLGIEPNTPRRSLRGAEDDKQ
jgi:hypothetical protein